MPDADKGLYVFRGEPRTRDASIVRPSRMPRIF